MSDENSAFLAALDEQLRYTDDEGVVLQVALFATLYIEDTYKREVRQAIGACCDDYFQRCGQHLRWALHPDTRLMERFGEGKGSSQGAWLPELGEDESFCLNYHSGTWHLGAAAFSLLAVGFEQRPYTKLGYLRFSFPVLWLSKHPAALPELLLDFCRRLKPISGYGGIGMNECADYGLASRYAPIEYEVAQRFPGFEAESTGGHGIWLGKGDGIKGVNWLTVVGDRFLARLGGADAVQAALVALDSGFIVHRFDGGVMIQAGPRPELGDAAQNEYPVLYVKLAKYLQPIRVTTAGSIHLKGAGERFDRERSDAWLRRFDDR